MPHRYPLPIALLCLTLGLPGAASAFSFPWWGKSMEQSQSAIKPAVATLPAPSISDGALADRILVKKSERRLYLMRGTRTLRSYRIALGYQPTGQKRYRGDGRTPEGVYFLDRRNERSNYYKAMHISYPNSQDRVRAMREGNDPGGAIMIHGQPSHGGTRNGDWTFGCIALSNMDMDEVWSMTQVGALVQILP
jgi:murein L,D-transpeptidase YafK